MLANNLTRDMGSVNKYISSVPEGLYSSKFSSDMITHIPTVPYMYIYIIDPEGLADPKWECENMNTNYFLSSMPATMPSLLLLSTQLLPAATLS